jgi:hypothetical protein
MKKITAADLIRLGFDRVDVSPEDNDGNAGWFYFIFDIKSKRPYPLLITVDDYNKEDIYSVEINELDDAVLIKDLGDLESLVAILKRNIIK